jgi:hypothetical protein
MIIHTHLIDMTVEPLSNAQSLRVIGQQLAGLGINAFELDKRGNEYFVRMDRGESAGKSPEKTFPKSIFEKTPSAPDTAREILNHLSFSTSQIIWSDTENRLRRGQTNAMPDANDLSTLLRVLGDYLDRKAAGDFAISCDMGVVTVSYDQRKESFRIENLYDLGVHMYLRRSNRDHAT